MEAFGATDITVDVIGHDAATFMVILKLPTGAIIPATISRANFNKHLIPMFANPPPKINKPTPVIEPETQVAVQSALEEAEEEKPDDIWWDPDAMFQDIRWHAKNNSRAVTLDERDVKPQRLAFKCDVGEKSWSVDMTYLYGFLDRLSNSDKTEDQTRAFQLRKCISTNEGKQRLVDALNNAIQ
jgi:hypothetical protein